MSTSPPDEPGLSDLEFAIRETAHRFAEEEMRPAGILLDRMTPGEVIADGSPLFTIHKRYRELGLDLIDVSADLTPLEAARVSVLVYEELGWGDLGLGWSCYASVFPHLLAKGMGREDLAERFTRDQIGCWGITEPNHGTDMLDFTHTVSAEEHGGARSNCVAVHRGNAIVIRGQKSAWCSNGSIADSMSLFCRYDDGSGLPKRAAFLVPLDLPGVKKSKPIDKLGVRSMTDSEIFFDDVEIPPEYMVCSPDDYEAAVAGIIVGANPGMALYVIGTARAAYEHALRYAKERIQGGRPIFEYQAVRLKLFEMYRKIEAARALARHVTFVHAGNPTPRFELAATAKVTGTQLALEVVNAAFEIYGGNGITKEYPIEKLLRDVRLGTIADGTNDVLSLMASSRL